MNAWQNGYPEIDDITYKFRETYENHDSVLVNRKTNWVKLENYTSPFETEKEFEKISLKNLLNFIKSNRNLRGKKYYTLGGHVEWKVQRIIWIGFNKNQGSDKCLIARLNKDAVRLVAQFIGKYVLVEDCFKKERLFKC